MSKVFVSYKNEDRARVRPLVDALAAAGFTVWWDVAIAGGAAWRATIQAELDAADCVVVVWSARSTGSDGGFVHDEAARAERRGVYLPVRIDPVEPPLGFGQRQVLPLDAWRGDTRDPRIADVIAAIRAKIDGGPPPVPRAAPRRRMRLLWPLVAAATAATAAGVAFVPRTLLCAVTGCAPAAPPNSVAVLPFANLSADPDQKYFSDGLSEDLVTALARIDALKVAGRTSSFRFRDSKDGSRDIGAKLGVAYILDGSVRRSSDDIRISAQLVDAASGFERWQATYDRSPKNLFAVQDEVAESVASALRVQLGARAAAALRRSGTANAIASDALLRGRAAFETGTGEAGVRAALAQFDAAIVADPRFAEAYAARGRALLALANQFLVDGRAQRDTYAQALAAARHAVTLAPDLPEAQISLAGALLYGQFDVSGARRAYSQALRNGAGRADVLLLYGLFACRIGAVASGLAAVQQAVVLDPLNPKAFKTLGLSLLVARDYPAAIVAFRHALALSPTMTTVRSAIGDALLLQGKRDAAAAEYAAEPDQWDKLRGEAIIAARRGDMRSSDAALAAMIMSGGDSTVYQQAEVHAQRGEAAQAVVALTRAFDVHDAGVLLIGSDPLLDPVRSLPAFAALAARLRAR